MQWSRRLLKPHAVPTIFSFEQSSKKRKSLMDPSTENQCSTSSDVTSSSANERRDDKNLKPDALGSENRATSSQTERSKEEDGRLNLEQSRDAVPEENLVTVKMETDNDEESQSDVPNEMDVDGFHSEMTTKEELEKRVQTPEELNNPGENDSTIHLRDSGRTAATRVSIIPIYVGKDTVDSEEDEHGETDSNSTETAQVSGQSPSKSTKATNTEPTPVNNCKCIVEKLLLQRFNSMPTDQKTRVLVKGRPMPTLRVAADETKHFSRNFFQENYKRVIWLCGCRRLNKLFCWPCLLFSNVSSIWNTIGFSDLQNFVKAEKTHRLSRKHLEALKCLKLRENIHKPYAIDPVSHNKRVTAKRKTLYHLIGASCFLATQGFVFNDKLAFFSSYVDLYKEVSGDSSDLKMYMGDNVNMFDVHVDILSSVGSLLMSEIKQEIAVCKFVSLILEGAQTVPGQPQISSKARYVCGNGRVKEMLVGVTQVKECSVNVMYQHVVELVEKLGCKEKIVAFSFDAYVVSIQDHSILQEKLVEKYGLIPFIHYHDHSLNLVITQSVDNIKECAAFLNSVDCFVSLLSKLTKFKSLSYIEVPSNFLNKYRVVQIIHKEKANVKNNLVEIRNSVDLDMETKSYVESLISFLDDNSFNFCLSLFSYLFCHADTLFLTLQRNLHNGECCMKKIEEFQEMIKNTTQIYETVWSYEIRSALEPIETEENEKYRRVMEEVLAVVSMLLTERYRDIQALKFLSIFEDSLYPIHAVTFPEWALFYYKDMYANYFDLHVLRSELCVLYAEEDMQKETLLEMLRYMKLSGLEVVFPEINKLVHLAVTMPAVQIDSDCMLDKRQNSGRLHITGTEFVKGHKTLLGKIRTNPSFYEKIIDAFAKKYQRGDLVYKLDGCVL